MTIILGLERFCVSSDDSLRWLIAAKHVYLFLSSVEIFFELISVEIGKGGSHIILPNSTNN